MRTLAIVTGALLVTVCGHDSTALNGGADFFDDFGDGTAARWTTDAGSWSVAKGQYLGGSTQASGCQGLGPNQSLIRDLPARDVDLQLDMTSLTGVDKGVILRSAGPENQLELNFRAERPGAFPADLVVQEIANCARTFHVPEFAVFIPHQVGQTVHVRIRLIGSQLTVWMDGATVLDHAFPFAERTGQVGVAVQGVTAFDNVSARVLTN